MTKLTKSYHWIYFFLYPFGTLLYYLKNFRKPAAKNVMWAFTIFFGLTIAIGSESQGSDIQDYTADIVKLHNVNFTFKSSVEYFENSGEVDVLRTFLSILVSRFTGNGYVLLMVYGLIFGYFFSRNMWFVLEKVQGKLKFATLLLIACLFLIDPIWQIGGFRFWTATHVFLYGLLPFLFNGNKKNLIWCFLTPVVFHYSFVVPVLILLIYLLGGNRLTIYFSFFVISLFISELNISRVNSFIENYAPTALVERSSSYRDVDEVKQYREGETAQPTAWYARYKSKFLQWPVYSFLILLFWKSRNIVRQEKSLLRMLSFCLLFTGFANFLTSIPSGGRFLSLAALVAVVLLTIYIQNRPQEKLMNKAIKLSLPLLVLFIIVSIREGFYYTSLFTIIGNPFLAVLSIGQNISLNDIIK